MTAALKFLSDIPTSNLSSRWHQLIIFSHSDYGFPGSCYGG